MVSLIVLAISITISVDLGLNYLNSTFTDKYDGIVISGFFASLLYGDSGWDVYSFFKTFSTSITITVLIGITNIVITIIHIINQRPK